MSSFTPSGSGGIPLSISTDGISSYSNITVSVPLAATEVSIVVPGTAIWISIYNRTDGLTKLAFSVGDSGTNYITIGPGVYQEYRKINGAALTLYVQCPKAAQELEITYGHS
jgi:hypothetical protein